MPTSGQTANILIVDDYAPNIPAAVAVFQDVEATPAEVVNVRRKWKTCLTLLSS